MVSLMLAVGCAQWTDWRHQRALQAAHAEHDAALASMVLPKIAGAGERGTAALRLSIDVRGVTVDDSAWSLSLAPAERAALIEPGDTTSHRALVRLPEVEPVSVQEPLRRALRDVADRRRQEEERTGRFEVDDGYALFAGGDLPFGVVASVIYSAGQASWSRAEIAVEGSDGRAVVVQEAPGICEHGIEGPPCALVTVTLDSGGWRAVEVPAQDSLCGFAMPLMPDQAVAGLRTEAFLLGEVEAMRAWIQEAAGEVPLCNAAILAAEPDMKWSDVVVGLDAIGRAGVRTPRLSVRQ